MKVDLTELATTDNKWKTECAEATNYPFSLKWAARLSLECVMR